MLKWISILCLSTLGFALNLGDTFPSLTLKNQFNQTSSLLYFYAHINVNYLSQPQYDFIKVRHF